MPLSVRRVSRWVACSVCRGWPRARRSFPLSGGPAEGSAEGVSNKAEIACFPRVGPYSRARRRCGALLEASAGRPRARRRSFHGFEGGLERAVPWSWAVGRVRVGPLWDLERIWVFKESWSSFMVSGCRAMTELSSLVASFSLGSPSSSPFSPSDWKKTVCLSSL